MYFEYSGVYDQWLQSKQSKQLCLRDSTSQNRPWPGVTGLETDHCRRRLTAILLVAAVRTVAEAVTAEASDDAVAAGGAGEESGSAFGLDFG